MITEFQLQTGEGTNVEIIGSNDLWLIIDEAHLVKMIQMAFDAPEFTLGHLLYALSQAENAICPKCQSRVSRWLNKPPKGQIGSGPAHFYCVACRFEWSLGEIDDQDEDDDR